VARLGSLLLVGSPATGYQDATVLQERGAVDVAGLRHRRGGPATRSTRVYISAVAVTEPCGALDVVAPRRPGPRVRQQRGRLAGRAT